MLLNLVPLLVASVPPALAFAVSTAEALHQRVAAVYARLVLTLAQVEVNPNSNGFPGGAMAQKILDWAGQLGLWGSLLSILVGACIWGVSQHFGNGLQTGKGKILVGAGAIGSVITGLGAIIVNTLFNAARA